MKRNSPRRKLDAFTAFELIICIVIVFLLVVLLLPQFSSRPTVRASRINCMSNLKITGLGFRMWSYDHNDQMPMMVSTNRRGSLEFIATGEVIRHFLAISNELSSPKVLACADDEGVKRATNFSLLTSKNVSYFVGLDADETKMQMLLSGDRNLTNGLPPNNHILQATGPDTFGWTKAIHNNAGNIGLADGSAAQTTTTTLRRQLTDPSNATNRLALP